MLWIKYSPKWCITLTLIVYSILLTLMFVVSSPTKVVICIIMVCCYAMILSLSMFADKYLSRRPVRILYKVIKPLNRNV
jgi:hypothetical protein|nr:MAG TPA: hypothetical protein [Caudoviricetes sp.]